MEDCGHHRIHHLEGGGEEREREKGREGKRGGGKEVS